MKQLGQSDAIALFGGRQACNRHRDLAREAINVLCARTEFPCRSPQRGDAGLILQKGDVQRTNEMETWSMTVVLPVVEI